MRPQKLSLSLFLFSSLDQFLCPLYGDFFTLHTIDDHLIAPKKSTIQEQQQQQHQEEKREVVFAENHFYGQFFFLRSIQLSRLK